MIGILCFWDRLATPYLDKYEKVLQEIGAEYEVVFWNRTGETNPNLAVRESEIRVPCRDQVLFKFLDFWAWRKEAKNLLARGKYDFLIILTTYPGVLLSPYLCRKYKGRYIFDIRDYSMERNPVFGYVVNKLIGCSAFTAISSKGFFRFLKPSPKIIINHNLYIPGGYSPVSISFREKEKIRFTFVGNVRLDKQTRAVLLSLKGSERYESCFSGRILPGCDIEEYCADNDIKNVCFSGPFLNQQKPLIYQNVDLINAIYANHEKRIRLADATPLPNRVYDAAVYQRPIVASKGTYLAELIDAYDMGFSVNGFAKDVEQQFDRYLSGFDEEKFTKGCQRFLSHIIAEEDAFLRLLKKTIKERAL